MSRNGSLNAKATVHAQILCDDEEPVLGGNHEGPRPSLNLTVGPQLFAGPVVFDKYIVDLSQTPFGQ